MAEGTLESQGKKGKLSRRGFLTVASAMGLAAISAYLNLDKLDAIEEKASQISLLSKVKAGQFNPEKLPTFPTLESLQSEVKKITETLDGVSAAGFYLSDNDHNAHIEIGGYTNKFFPGSLYKIPLMYYVWLKGQKDGVNYIDEKTSENILGKSQNMGDFLLNLPFNKNRKSEELGLIIKDMLESLKIPIEISEKGNITLNIIDYFNFLRKTNFPPIIINAMKQTSEDDNTNYSVSKVLRTNYKNIGNI